MDRRYITYFQLNISHEYWNLSNPQLFDFSFSEETLLEFKRMKIVIKQHHNKLSLIIPEDNLEKPKQEQLTFVLHLIQRDHLIKNYTDTDAYNDDKVSHYTNLENQQKLSDPTILPIHRTLHHLVFEGEVTNCQNISISKLINTQPDQAAFSRNVNALPEGWYHSTKGDLYYQAQLKKSLFAVITFDCTRISPSSTFNLDLNSRQLYLSYHIRAKEHKLNQLQVIDSDSKVLFEAFKESDEMIFITDQPVKLTEKSNYHFQLINGTKKPIREQLPLGNTHNLKSLPQKGNSLLNEIFIHV